MATKNRAVLIIIKDNDILLMHRFENGEGYYIFPGGGIEEGESIEEAAIREAKEEAGLDVTLGRKLWGYENKSRFGYCYLVDRFSGEL